MTGQAPLLNASGSPTKYALYSIAASLATMAMKFTAWVLTSSVGLLGDATESLVNLTAAGIALTALLVALRPADSDHTYGHGKAEYFSSGAEGVLIIAAAVGIAWASVHRFLHPVPLDSLGLGLIIALLASAVNLFTARSMLRAARRYDSIVLEADAKHLLTDVWTSAGMVAGLAIIVVAPPSWQILDPVIGLLLAGHIAHTGYGLVRESANALMDRALPKGEVEAIIASIRAEAGAEARFHDLHTRKAGTQRFIEFHLLLPGETTVRQSHDLCCRIEDAVRDTLGSAHITIHVEPRAEHDRDHDDGHAKGSPCPSNESG